MKLIRIFFFLFVLVVAAGCAPDRPVGRAYHNLNARFNGYFLAREKMIDIEARIAASTVNDYNRVLDILPPIDTTFLATLKPDLEDVIKRASFPIARHPKSKWVDDCYILIGRARYYQGEDAEAIKAFRFVQTTSKNKHAKHEALVWLMRTYLKQKDYDAARAVSDQFRRERMNSANGRELLLTRAQLAAVQNNLPQEIENLERSLPYIEGRDHESKIRFILGQLYQATNQEQKAYQQYQQVLKKNPPYELGFYAKLNMAQVTELKDVSDKEKVAEFLTKLSHDEKNIEYLDKIYYDLAKLELRQNAYKNAINYLHKSTAASTTNKTQKAYSYLLEAQIHYEHLQQYKLAQSYYDSTLQYLPPTTLGYDELTDRRTVLTAFTQQLEIIRTEDSLQTLAKLDPAARAQRVTEQIALEREQQEQAAQQAAAANTNPSGSAPATITLPGLRNNNGSAWYFDNPNALATARNDFLRAWGDRPLQDNWRRASALSLTTNLAATPAAATATDNTALIAAETARQQEYLQAIPVTPEQRQASDKRLEEALFTLANIYYQRLQEPEKATETFQNLLTRYPATAHASEVYYSLYLIAQNLKKTEQAATYARTLKERFPNSKYSRLIDQPDFLQAYSAENKAAHTLYDSAYAHFQAEKFKTSTQYLDQLTKQYPGNDIPDQVAFLRVLLTIRTQPSVNSRQVLETFMQQYPDSPLRARAQEILVTQDRLRSEAQASLTAVPKQEPAVVVPPSSSRTVPTQVSYQVDSTASHFFVVVVPKLSISPNDLVQSFSTYNQKQHAAKKLSVSTAALDDSTTLLIVQPFPDYKGANQYSRMQRVRNSPLSSIKGPKFATFVITEKNLQVLQQTRNLKEYLAFFENSY